MYNLIKFINRVETLEVTYDSDGKDPEKQSVKNHGNIFPVFTNLVRVLCSPDK